MSALNLWLAAPRFDRDDEERERSELTDREREAVRNDLFGISSASDRHCGGSEARVRQDVNPAFSPDDDDESESESNAEHDDARHACQEVEALSRGLSLDQVDANDDEREIAAALSTLQKAIDVLPESTSSSFHEACRRCPHVCGRDQRRTFLVHGRTNEGKYDAEGTANALCTYWSERARIFGERGAYAPLAVDSAPMDIIKRGLMWRCGRDESGRAVLVTDKSQLSGSEIHSLPRNCLIQSVWYVLEAIMNDTATSRNGVVVIILNDEKVDLEKVDRKTSREMIQLFQSFPIAFKAFHQIRPPWYYKHIWPVLSYMLSREMRLRIQFHYGPSDEDVMESLSEHGLCPWNVPRDIGGEATFDPISLQNFLVSFL